MSLQVWLPFVRDTNNQGVSSVAPNITSTYGSITSNGKLGDCFHTTSTGDLDTGYSVDLTKTSVSLCGWFKFNKAEIQAVVGTKTYTSSATRATANLIGNISYGGIGICFTTNDLYADSKVLSALNIFGTLRTATPASVYTTTTKTITFDEWIHICVVYDKAALKLSSYFNGQLYATTNITAFTEAVIRDIYINYAHIYSGNGPACAIPYYCNDLRVYNHALSAKEIKELSKGLVAHYTLGDSYLEGTTNLITSYTAGGRTTLIDNGNAVQTTGENADTYFRINTPALVSGTTYTLSMCAKGISVDSYWKFRFNNNTSFPFFIYNGYNTYTFTADSSLNGITNALIDDELRPDYANKAIFYNIQLESKNHATGYAGMGGTRNDTTVYDSSGYNYHGTINTAMTISSNTSRYSVSTSFNGTDNTITIPFNTICPTNIFTINIWFYKDALGSKNYETLFGGPSGFEMDTRAGSATTLSLYMASTRGGNIFSPLEFNKWNMITMVRDGTNELYYVNGDLKKTIEAKSMPTGDYRLGSWNGTTSQNYYGLMSDFRIYSTCLSADDIKELYQVGASIDKSGNMYAYEFNEV